MIFAPLRYHAYKFLSSRMLTGSPKQYRKLLSNETLGNLKQRLKESHTSSNKVVADLSTQQLAICHNIHNVFNAYGKPAYVKTNKSGGIIHDVVLYKRMINGLKSKVVYNFVNQRIASVSYVIQVISKTDEQRVNHFIKETSIGIPKKAYKAKRLEAEKTTDYQPTEISLTFVNHNPEVIQNINAAVYIDKYSNSNIKYVDSSKFQLTF
jgi:hypothetical protein